MLFRSSDEDIALLISDLPYPMSLIGSALCGTGIGAAIDLMALFVGRYFGVKARTG